MTRPEFLVRWTQRYEGRRELRHAMLTRLEIAPSSRPDRAEQRDIRETMLGCETCTRTRDCRDWLALGAPTIVPPSFCAGRAAFVRLMARCQPEHNA